jgi:hypothetical protein
MSESVAPAACKPNISSAGQQRRMRFGYQWLVASVALLVVLLVFRVPAYVGLLMFIPASMSAVGFLQARRHTCVMRAKEGTFEHEDFSTTKAGDEEVAASRAVASTINRDTVLIGLGAAVVGVLASLVVHHL